MINDISNHQNYFLFNKEVKTNLVNYQITEQGIFLHLDKSMDDLLIMVTSKEFKTICLTTKPNCQICGLIYFEGAEKYNFEVEVNDDTVLKLSHLYYSEITKKEMNISVKLNHNSVLDIIESELGNGDLTIHKKYSLVGKNAALSANNILVHNKLDNVEEEIVIEHVVESTKAVYNAYAVAQNDASIKIDIECNIPKGVKKTDSRQLTKGIIFGEKAGIESSPKLLISENDVFAAHGSAIGRIDDNSLYYLMSRGLTEDDAKQIIIKGFTLPLFLSIIDDKLRMNVEKLVYSYIRGE